MIKVLFVADIRLYREGLAHALSLDPRFEVVGSAPTVAHALELIGASRPDVVVLDMAMLDAYGALRRLRAADGGTRVLALAVPNVEPAVLACAEIGVTGFVTREQPLESLCDAVVRAAHGEAVCSPAMTATLLRRIATLSTDRAEQSQDPGLTRREQQILDLVSRGLSNKAIAAELCIEVCTVKNHVHHILEKLGVGRRGEAAAWGRRVAASARAVSGELASQDSGGARRAALRERLQQPNHAFRDAGGL